MQKIKSTIGLVWFKNDLRLHDNEALCQAIATCDVVVCVYAIESSLFTTRHYGFRKADVLRFKFLEQSLMDLQQNLKKINGQLIITIDSALVDVPKLVQEYSITEIFAETEYAFEELQLIDRLKEKLPDIAFNFYWGKTLYHKDDIPFTIADIPLTSKAYRIPTSKQSEPRIPFKSPSKINAHLKAKNTPFPSYTIYGFTKEDYDQSTPYVMGGESAALERLNYYTFQSEHLTAYRWTRNKSLGMDYSSKFSPYLALGCISPREIYKVVKAYELQIKKNQSTWWIIFELVWRDYFTFKGMKFGNSIFGTSGFKNKTTNFDNNQILFDKWKEGTTGIPFVDAHMRQLNQTGYMSNRGRVNCASFFVKDLNIDWTWGASYFESKLIDYDVSANWMNWHMQAFEIYYTNPVNQAIKYDAKAFIQTYISELSDVNDHRIYAPWEYDIPNYPAPTTVFDKWQRAINRIKKSVEES
ncbi:deoxyribodipyrimidine photo-lyase [Gelidibacter algens]|uniref:Cryptochrome DASH n=1 Tax=Gelidibacter algens TaxID=49280 RepID=A0A1A7R3B1_9FLAO|nr:DASH family cryptochrome [Gelidibacter algens]OBX25257.1 DASH family cryptochrome [Gelidibacter algens]RAJ20976.1 deoxyribodipyrimidine photo-lyase [Gelidibacter algens]